MSPTFQADTMSRRESGSRRSASSSCEIWSMWPPSGVGQARREERRGVGAGAQCLERLRDLVDVPSGGRRPGPPLDAVDRPEITVRRGPLVPDRDAVLLQPFHVALAAEKPQQLVGDRAEM